MKKFKYRLNKLNTSLIITVLALMFVILHSGMEHYLWGISLCILTIIGLIFWREENV